MPQRRRTLLRKTADKALERADRLLLRNVLLPLGDWSIDIEHALAGTKIEWAALVDREGSRPSETSRSKTSKSGTVIRHGHFFVHLK
jgi:hypothetical protein